MSPEALAYVVARARVEATRHVCQALQPRSRAAQGSPGYRKALGILRAEESRTAALWQGLSRDDRAAVMAGARAVYALQAR